MLQCQANEAKQELFKQVEQQTATEMTAYIKDQEEEARSKASLLSRDIMLMRLIVMLKKKQLKEQFLLSLFQVKK